MDELRCRFFGVVLGDEGVVAVAGGGGGLIGGESNGSRGGGPFFFGIKMVISGSGMDLWSGVDGGLIMRGCFGDEGVE